MRKRILDDAKSSFMSSYKVQTSQKFLEDMKTTLCNKKYKMVTYLRIKDSI